MSAEDKNYLTADSRLFSWLFTTDHKRVAILFFATITLFFFVGGAAAVMLSATLGGKPPGGTRQMSATADPAAVAANVARVIVQANGTSR